MLHVNHLDRLTARAADADGLTLEVETGAFSTRALHFMHHIDHRV